jgi:molybdenum-dependent DNA-binding transcriptional regulator ModE
VKTQVGGSGGQRSSLTPLAAELVRQFDEVRDEVCHLVDRVYAARLQQTLHRHGVGVGSREGEAPAEPKRTARP